MTPAHFLALQGAFDDEKNAAAVGPDGSANFASEAPDRAPDWPSTPQNGDFFPSWFQFFFLGKGPERSEESVGNP